jgi:HEAT repeat protein
MMNTKVWSNLFCARARMLILNSVAALLLPTFSFAATPAELVAQLRAPNVPARAEAVDKLLAAGPDAIPAVVAGMGDYKLRPILMRLLPRYGAKAETPLFELLERKESRVNAAAALAVVVGADSSDRIPALLSCARDPEVANSCGTALIRSAPKARKHVKLLVKALSESQAAVRAIAAAALGQVEGRPSEAVEPLTAALADSEPTVRASAAAALGHFGSKARKAVPALTNLKQDSSPEVRVAAVEALKSING